MDGLTHYSEVADGVEVAWGVEVAPRSRRVPRSRAALRAEGGFSLIESLVVLAILAIVGVVGAVSLSESVRRQEARGAAQVCQAAVAWGQLGVLWNGGAAGVGYRGGLVSVSHDGSLFGGNLGPVGPVASIDSNVARWLREGGAGLGFAGWSASPDTGGSLFFRAPGGSYRVAVRPGSGLTARTWAGSD